MGADYDCEKDGYNDMGKNRYRSSPRKGKQKQKTGDTGSDGDVHMQKQRNAREDYMEPNEEQKTRTRMGRKWQTKKKKIGG